MNPKVLFMVGALVGVAIVILWLSAHKRCPQCQERWAQIKNAWGSRLIEPKPE